MLDDAKLGRKINNVVKIDPKGFLGEGGFGFVLKGLFRVFFKKKKTFNCRNDFFL